MHDCFAKLTIGTDISFWTKISSPIESNLKVCRLLDASIVQKSIQDLFIGKTNFGNHKRWTMCFPSMSNAELRQIENVRILVDAESKRAWELRKRLGDTQFVAELISIAC